MLDQENFKYAYKFTVFTPTYNRAHTIERVYESLKNQTFKDFEWLIVDDGSTDNTKDLVEMFIRDSWFPIRFYYKNNGGKHTAFNLGVQLAKGELFLSFDSDDKCVFNALERFNFHWDKIIKEEKANKFTGVTSLCSDKDGNIIGDKFPFDIFDSNSLEKNFKYRIKGEKWGFHQTEILKKFPFKEFKGEKFITENSVWFQIAKFYQTRYINETLRIYEINGDSLSKRIINLNLNCPQGSYYTNKKELELKLPFVNKLKSMINCSRFSYLDKHSFFDCIKSLGLFSFAIMPIGLVLILKDKIKN